MRVKIEIVDDSGKIYGGELDLNPINKKKIEVPKLVLKKSGKVSTASKLLELKSNRFFDNPKN
jgi:hypothetical protein